MKKIKEDKKIPVYKTFRFTIVESAALIETAMDSVKHPKYGTIWWINYGGSHIIATKKPNGALDIHAMGTHQDIAAKWKNLKSKIHTGSQTISDSMVESQLTEMTVDTVKSPKGLIFYWVRSQGYDAIITNKPQLDGTISLDIVKMGPPKEIAQVWKQVKTKLSTQESVSESATAGSTSAGNISSVANPHLAIGKASKSYTGSPGKSGTRAPTPPKMKMQKPGTNALDSNMNIFGTGKVVKRK